METAIASPEARLAILRQHTQLGHLLDELEGHAIDVIDGKDSSGKLNDALVLLHRRFLRHLELEEAQLAAVLENAPAERTAALRASLADHAEQRLRIDGLLHDRAVFTDSKTVAREALAFVHSMRADMAAEDAALRTLG